MKLTKCFLVASAASMASALMSNVPNHKNEVFKASILDTNVRLMVERLHNSQGKTNLNNFANYYFSNLNNNLAPTLMELVHLLPWVCFCLSMTHT